MKVNVGATLTFAGVGAFFGFLLAVFAYGPYENQLFAYGIYVGLIIGAVLGLRADEEWDFRTSAVSFVLGAVVTLALALWWANRGINATFANVMLGIVLGTSLFIKPTNFTDALLSPATYLGGASAVLLLLKDYGPLQSVEHGVTAILIVTGSAMALTFFGALGRWGFEKFRNFGRKGK
ncbi:hypothetical protein [Thermococcus sp. 9N3]|uniref:hypothetical protein n=1 Tax=Thermococcus sp. 9N3 TaxID=163002 RepID=UPI001431B4FA|nr:hypothetical protein [Thermococcus sp. 9N3]NJE48688.1 hypothetical protein [Thermococcus sp. 9N3]